MEGRVDQERYSRGLHDSQNFIPLVSGPAMRRSGTVSVTAVKNSANRTWLRRFEFSQSQAFQIEFGDFYLRFYTNHGQVIVTNVAQWDASITYAIGSLVQSSGVNYYCVATNLNQAPPNATYWYALTGNVYEIPTPWPAAALTNSQGAFAFKTVQSGDVIYIAAGQAGYAPQTLTRFGGTNWVLTPFFPTDGPFLTQNADLTKAMWTSGTTGSVTVSASFPAFAPTDVGRLVRLQVQNFNTPTWTSQVAYTAGQRTRFNGNTYLALNSATSGNNPPIQIKGTSFDGYTGAPGVQWLYEDSGYGIAKITAYISTSQVTATVLQQFPFACIGTSAAVTGISQANPAVVTATQSFGTGDMVFIYAVGGMGEINNKLAIATARTGSTLTLGQIDSTTFTAYSSGGFVVDQATTLWSLGQWSNTTEWPRAAAFFRGRLWMFGSLFCNGSVPGLYTSFALDTAGIISANNSIQIAISFDEVNTVQWAAAVDRLIVGCDGGEFAIYEQTPNEVLGPANVQIVRQSLKRCNSVDPELVGTTLIYVQRAGRKVLAMDYDFSIDKYHSNDLTSWAYTLTHGQVCDVSFAAEPWSILWYVRNDGTLLGLTFDKDQQVYSWHPHTMGGSYMGGPAVVECVSTIPAPTADRDELWMIVKRTINNVTVRSVEYLAKDYQDGDTQASAFYVDCGLSGTFATNGINPYTLSGLSYLAGQTVSILCNGAAIPNQVVSRTGTITIALNSMPSSLTVNVGLPAPGYIVTERPEAGADVGTSQGKTKRTNWAAIRLYNTLGGSFGIDGQTLDEIQYRIPPDLMDQPPPLLTGDFIKDAFPGDYETDNRFRFETNQPLPATVVAIFPKVVGYEPT